MTSHPDNRNPESRSIEESELGTICLVVGFCLGFGLGMVALITSVQEK